MPDQSILTIGYFRLVFVLFVETLLFGGFVVLYPISVWILLYRERRKRQSRMGVWMFATVTVMFIMALVHLAFDVQYAILAFVRHSSSPGGPGAYFTTSEGDKAIAHIVDPILFAILTLVGDSFMTYRTYVVWERKIWAIVLPVLLLSGMLFCAGSIGYGLYSSPQSHHRGGDGFFSEAIFPQMVGYFILTLLTNLSLTLLLLGRILWSGRETRRYLVGRAAASIHWRVMQTIIQSEAAYSVAVVLNLVAYVARSNLVLITFAALPPLVGISFTMIITRIGLSEVVRDPSGSMPVLDNHSTTWEMAERTRPGVSSPIAITVMISKSDDGDHSAVYPEKAAAAAVCDDGASRSTLHITADSGREGSGDLVC